MTLLKELRVTEIVPNALRGGTTKPFLVIAEDGRKYVMKLFGKQHTTQRCYTGAEICAYFLAQQFDLPIPNGVLLSLTPELLELTKTSNPELYNELQFKDHSKPCFGSLYIESAPIFSPALNDRLLDPHEFETIFAFDQLILNEDRKSIKPNILRAPEHYFLIDHEKAFEGYKYASDLFSKGSLAQYHKTHLFYERLCAMEKKNPGRTLFETFFEYFRSLDTYPIRRQLHQLKSYGYEIQDCLAWLDYIDDQKRKCSIFVALLIKHIKQ